MFYIACIGFLFCQGWHQVENLKGGRRPRAGRPRADTENVWLKIRTNRLKRLRAMVPVGKRSEFVSDLINTNL
jgi:hypothetical protein